MRLFWELTQRAFQRQITYRAATISGLITNFFFGLLRAAVLIALYAGRASVEGVTLDGAVTYTALSQASIAFLSLFSWFELIHTVYTGSVAGDLLKPMDYFTYWMAQDLGRSLASLFLRTLPIILFYTLFFRLVLPPGPLYTAALLPALSLAWLISFSWRFLVNLSAFWVPNAVGIGRMAYGFSWFLSGFLMPLRFMPEWFQTLCNLTPFPSMLNTIVEIYLGVLDGPHLVQALLVQVFWAVALIGLSQLALRAGVKRLVILGG